jgi:hypothetical protein
MRLRHRDDRLAARLHEEFEALRGQLHAEVDGAIAAATTQLERADEAMRERESFAIAQHEQALTKALERVADALDGIGTHLQLERRDRASQSATVEFLLRELVVAFSNPVPDVPTVIGGTIEPWRLRNGPNLDARSPAGISDLATGVAVEVRSRFQRRWVGGFEVAGIESHEGRAQYRLVRRLDHEELPVLFDAEDVRPDGASDHAST